MRCEIVLKEGIKLEVEYHFEPYNPGSREEPPSGGGIDELTIVNAWHPDGVPIAPLDELNERLGEDEAFFKEVETACHNDATQEPYEPDFERDIETYNDYKSWLDGP